MCVCVYVCVCLCMQLCAARVRMIRAELCKVHALRFVPVWGLYEGTDRVAVYRTFQVRHWPSAHAMLSLCCALQPCCAISAVAHLHSLRSAMHQFTHASLSYAWSIV